LWPFALFYGNLVYVVAILIFYPPFGIFNQEKSGNPGSISMSALAQKSERSLAPAVK
jgi:hypothetical protein